MHWKGTGSETLKLKGSSRKNPLQFLGSNMSFLDIQVAKLNELLITRTLPMIITVANEQKMTSVRVLFGVTIGYLSKN
jgi:hypothetical protein